MLISLQLSEAGTNICWPEFVPQITDKEIDNDIDDYGNDGDDGGDVDDDDNDDDDIGDQVTWRRWPPGFVTVRVSVRQSPATCLRLKLN